MRGQVGGWIYIHTWRKGPRSFAALGNGWPIEAIAQARRWVDGWVGGWIIHLPGAKGRAH